jgi:hypothetical protein
MSDVDSVDRLPADSYHLETEWSRSDADERHRVGIAGVLTAGKLFRLGVILSASSGGPYTITTGRDDNRDGVAVDRPIGVRRNSGQGPGSLRLDLRWSRDFRFERLALDGNRIAASIAADAFNVLNRVNYSGYVGNLSSPFFGRPTSAQAARRLQLSFRVQF